MEDEEFEDEEFEDDSFYGKPKFDDNTKSLIENVKKVIKDIDAPDRDKKIERAMNALYENLATYPENIREKNSFQFARYKIESLLFEEYLPIKNEPIYDPDLQIDYPEETLSEKDYIQTLDCLVHSVRTDFSQRFDIKNASLRMQCISSRMKVDKECEKRGIDFFNLRLNNEMEFGDFHHLNIVSFLQENGDRKNYLVDCTYRQFFRKGDSFIKRIEAIGDRVMSMGTYMMMTEKRQRLAEELLTKGYIEATPENLKEYFDAVVFAGRDLEFYKSRGLNYMNPDDCIPEYSLDDYIDMILGNNVVYDNPEVAVEVFSAMREKRTILDMSVIEKRIDMVDPDDMRKMSRVLGALVKEEREESK